jgi:hypothetical protein
VLLLFLGQRVSSKSDKQLQKKLKKFELSVIEVHFDKRAFAVLGDT